MNFNILIVDDVRIDAEAISAIVSELANVKTTIANSPSEALKILSIQPRDFALIISDYNMPEMNGVEFSKNIWKLNSKQLVAILSGNGSEVAIRCVGTPIVEFIQKDEESTRIQKKVQALLAKYSVTSSSANLFNSSEVKRKEISKLGLVGSTESMSELCKQIMKISAHASATILIRGESGTGKELVAKAIHSNSPRRNGPFKALNINAINENLIESELFGHEKGAFTGAVQRKKGAFELAHNGTIFLDEIGDLKPDLQVKLLRVLQEKEIQTVGGTQPIPVNVRVIAATHVDLESKIENHEFRLDLYHRLNIVDLKIPNLRERSDDIGILASHFLQKFGSNKTISPVTMKHLEHYNWPGNVRELENLIEKLTILVEDDEIMPEHLPSHIFENVVEKSSKIDLSVPYEDFTKVIRDLEKQYLSHHLSKSRSIRDAAKNRTGMALQTLRDKMKIHNLTFDTKEDQSNEAAI